MSTATVAIVYHSGYGKTKFMAERVLKGAQSVPGVSVSLITVDDALKNLDALTAADAIVFGCPTYMASMSAKMKELLEAASKIWYHQKWKDKLAAGFTNSQGPSGDKLNTLEGLMLNAMQHGMIWVGTGMLPGANNTAGTDLELNRLSSYIGPMAQSPQGSQQPLEADLSTAEHFGKRIAETTLRWTRGK
ncbi:MAG TPA: flavodoxin family protein [Fibrobacteria bacterium]|nr:flavodoxin family protein [Fibrobacteria bacterium]